MGVEVFVCFFVGFGNFRRKVLDVGVVKLGEVLLGIFGVDFFEKVLVVCFRSVE